MSEPRSSDGVRDEPLSDPPPEVPLPKPAVERKTLVPIEVDEVRTVPGEVVPVEMWTATPISRFQRPDPPNRPLIQEYPLRRLNAFYRLPRARARTGLVMVTPRSGPTPVGPNGRPARTEIFWTGATLYEVDLGLHHTTIEFDLPSKNDLISFTARAEIEWRVVDEARVVADNIHDIREALTPLLRQRLRSITRGYVTTQLSAADEAASQYIGGWDPGKQYGLWTSIVLRLAADAQSADHATLRLKLRQQMEIENLEHELKNLSDRHEQERQRARLAVYREIIAKGNIEQFALQLASNPEDLRTVMNLFREERSEERRQLTDFLTQLLSSGAIDRWDVEDQVREALTWLAESTQRAVQSGEYEQRWSHPPKGNNTRNGRSSA